MGTKVKRRGGEDWTKGGGKRCSRRKIWTIKEIERMKKKDEPLAFPLFRTMMEEKVEKNKELKGGKVSDVEVPRGVETK